VATLLLVLASRVHAQGADAKPDLNPAQVARAAGEMAPVPEVAAAAGDDAVRRAFQAIDGVKLVQKSDGSFVYTGRGFNARIDARGGLTLTDRFSRASFVVDPKPLDELNWVTYFFRISFDLYARLDKAFGNDPFRTERRDFLEATRDLRMALLERNAARALERALHKIATSATKSPAEKRRLFFELWAECSDDPYGDRVRARIEQYIRERCPPGSVCEYTPQELERLNPPRAGARAFAPYAADAGVP
jgi:hypothetical protein